MGKRGPKNSVKEMADALRVQQLMARGKKGHYSEEQQEAHLTLVMEGVNIHQLSKISGVPYGTISRWVYESNDALRILKRSRAEALATLLEAAIKKVVAKINDDEKLAALDPVSMSVVASNLGKLWIQLNNPDVTASKYSVVKGQETISETDAQKVITRSFESWIVSTGDGADGDGSTE